MNLNVLINLIGRSKQEIIRKLVLGPELRARFPKMNITLELEMQSI